MNLLQEAKRLADAAGGGWLPTDSARQLTATAGNTIDKLMLKLIPLASSLAKPALSGFHVGAVALGASGALYFGANFEFASCALNQTVHAEQAAVINAARHGETGLSKLAVSAAPCGYCRQFLYELATADQLEILLADSPPTKLSKYLPGAFGPANLGVEGGLLTRHEKPLTWASKTNSASDAAELTLQAARDSYAPYSKAFAAVGLITLDGTIFVGPYFENAAFNPSISPIQAAVVALMLTGRSPKDIASAISVQLENSPIDHTAATRSFLAHAAPHVAVRDLLIRASQEQQVATAGTKKVPAPTRQSFYFFDFDDNIMYLSTPILIRNRRTGRSKKVTTTEFAEIRKLLGQTGPWKDFEIFEGTYRHFRDIPADQIKPSHSQYFLEDIEKAVSAKGTDWQAPSWPLLVYACQHQRPTVIITARGHGRKTIAEGLRLLAKKKLIPRAPKLFAVYPIGNPDVAGELIEGVSDSKERQRLKGGVDMTSDLKRLAIRQAVDMALQKYGAELDHHFGMSDDDPLNVDLIIKALCDCKVKYIQKRFFVINTHKGEWVKLEVFPATYSVAGDPFVHSDTNSQ